MDAAEMRHHAHDGCAAFTPEIHATAIAALRPVARIATIATALA
jgi:ureidoacrylate peracid hydrolase